MARALIKREILVRAGAIAVRARLLDTPSADRIWRGLPIYAAAEMREGTLVLPLPLAGPLEVAQPAAPLATGAFALSAARDGIVIICGSATPPIQGHAWALALDDVAPLAELECGDRVALLEADS
jgi:uncharacterized protein